MTYAFLHAIGFEMKAATLFDVVQPADDSGFVNNVLPGGWSRYCYNPNNGFGKISLCPAGTTQDVWVAWNWWPGTDGSDVGFYDAAGNKHIYIGRNNATGKLYVANGAGTTLAESTHSFLNGIWHGIEAWFHIADAGGQVVVRVDGFEEINYTGDTRTGASTAGIAVMEFNDRGINYYLDDIVVGTGLVGDYPGAVKVFGSVPNADGSVTQLLRGPASVTRWYMPSGDPSPVNSGIPSVDANAAPISPAFDSSWEKTSLAKRRKLTAAKGVTSMVTDTFAYSGISANDDLLWYQFVSPPIAAQTISGTVKGQMSPQEVIGSEDERMQVVIRVVSNDGTTVRGTLLATDTAALANEFNNPYQNRKTPRGSPATLSSVVASAGDRIVVEIGARHHGATTTTGSSVRVGESNATDLPENETDANAYNPWIEFSAAITLGGNADLASELGTDDNTYLYETVTGKYDLYTMTDVSTFDSVVGVTLYARGKRSDAGSGSVQLAVRQGATESFGASLALALGYIVVSRDMPIDPTDSLAWSAAKANSLQAGWKVI